MTHFLATGCEVWRQERGDEWESVSAALFKSMSLICLCRVFIEQSAAAAKRRFQSQEEWSFMASAIRKRVGTYKNTSCLTCWLFIKLTPGLLHQKNPCHKKRASPYPFSRLKTLNQPETLLVRPFSFWWNGATVWPHVCTAAVILNMAREKFCTSTLKYSRWCLINVYICYW